MANHIQIAAAEKLREQIAGLFQGNTELTMHEVAELAGTTYHTARNHINALVAEGRLDLTGRTKNKAVCFSRPASKLTPKMPTFSGDRIGLDAYFKRQAYVGSHDTMASALLSIIPDTVAWAYDQASLMTAGDKYNVDTANEKRRALIQAKQIAEVLVQRYQALLNADVLWGPDIKGLMLDPDAEFKFTTDDVTNYRHAIQNNEPLGEPN